MITLFNYTYSAVFSRVNEQTYISYFGGYTSTITEDTGFYKLHIKDSEGHTAYYRVLFNKQECLSKYLHVLREYHPPIKWIYSPEQSKGKPWYRFLFNSVSNVYALDIEKGSLTPDMLFPDMEFYTEASRVTSGVESIYSGVLSTAHRIVEQQALSDFIQFYSGGNNEKVNG